MAAFALTLTSSGMPLGGLTDAAGAAVVAMTSAALTGWALGGVSVAIISRGGLHDQLKDR